MLGPGKPAIWGPIPDRELHPTSAVGGARTKIPDGGSTKGWLLRKPMPLPRYGRSSLSSNCKEPLSRISYVPRDFRPDRSTALPFHVGSDSRFPLPQYAHHEEHLPSPRLLLHPVGEGRSHDMR